MLTVAFLDVIFKKHTYVSHIVESYQVGAGSWVLCTKQFFIHFNKIGVTHINLTQRKYATK